VYARRRRECGTHVCGMQAITDHRHGTGERWELYSCFSPLVDSAREIARASFEYLSICRSAFALLERCNVDCPSCGHAITIMPFRPRIFSGGARVESQRDRPHPYAISRNRNARITTAHAIADRRASSPDGRVARERERESERALSRTIATIDPPNFNKGHRVFAERRDARAAWAAL